jgi:hypothetical protein
MKKPVTTPINGNAVKEVVANWYARYAVAANSVAPTNFTNTLTTVLPETKPLTKFWT